VFGAGRWRLGGHGGLSEVLAAAEGIGEHFAIGEFEDASGGDTACEACDSHGVILEEVGDEQGGAVAFESWVGGHDDFANSELANAVYKLVDGEIFGADAFEGSDATAEHVIESGPGGGGFEGDDIFGLFDDADAVLIAAGIFADAADGFFGEVEADGAAADGCADVVNGVCEGLGVTGGAGEYIVGEAFGGFAADAGEFGEFVDEAADGGAVGVVSRVGRGFGHWRMGNGFYGK
jgi:hypothetical protein